MKFSECKTLVNDLLSSDKSTRENAQEKLCELNHQCETHTYTDNSPYPVKDDESVLKLIFCPQHIDSATTEIKPSMIHAVMSDSVIRVQLIGSTDCLMQLANKKTEEMKRNNPEKPRELLQGLFISVKLLREASYNNGQLRAFGIYATGLPTDFTHADIVRSKTSKTDKLVVCQYIIQNSVQKSLHQWQVPNAQCYCSKCKPAL